MDGVPILPQDVMLLICQELGASREFTTLRCCALVSRRIASIALEELYSVAEATDPFFEDDLRAAQLWRSIILSSTGATLYPYCAYIRTLSLSDLQDVLENIRSKDTTTEYFFGGPMQRFYIHDHNRRTRSRRPLLDLPTITKDCADSITHYVKGLADNSGTAVALNHFETNLNSRDMLLICISRLVTLKSLKLLYGSVLDMEIASAIAERCPKFTELTCYLCTSERADTNMALFLHTLRPNTLQRFEIVSSNSLGAAALSALNNHAESLRALHLGNLILAALMGLHLPSRCTALESLVIENDMEAGSVESNLTLVAEWISSCASLRELTFKHFGDALPILHKVLQNPDIHLEHLDLQGFRLEFQNSLFHPEEITKAIWKALGRQSRLKVLILTAFALPDRPDGLKLAEHPELTDSICRLNNLTTLNLMEAHVSSEEITRIVTALPQLEELGFAGDLIDNSVLSSLSKLSRLTVLTINAMTAFTFDNLWTFAQRLDEKGNQGIQVDIYNQWHWAKLRESEELQLKEYFETKLKGRFTITYPNDPAELHEGDFSDSE